MQIVGVVLLLLLAAFLFVVQQPQQYAAALSAHISHHSVVNYIPVTLAPRLSKWDVERQNTVVRGQVILKGGKGEKYLNSFMEEYLRLTYRSALWGKKDIIFVISTCFYNKRDFKNGFYSNYISKDGSACLI